MAVAMGRETKRQRLYFQLFALFGLVFNRLVELLITIPVLLF